MRWFADTMESLHTASPSSHVETLKYVVRFWSQGGTGRLRFLSADTQVILSFMRPNPGSLVALAYDEAKEIVTESMKGV